MAATARLSVQRKKGGKVPDVVSGNPKVLGEAEEDKTGQDDTVKEAEDRKKGGKVKRAKGGKIVGLMTGGAAPMRADRAARRPGRKAGGAVGANTSPLSTAHNASGGTSGSANPADTYGGTPS